jgi:hypothetical protein
LEYNELIARDLQKQLEALDRLLQSLQETAFHGTAGFVGLNVLLFSCEKAYKEFKEHLQTIGKF